jgi:hypothetical protein
LSGYPEASGLSAADGTLYDALPVLPKQVAISSTRCLKIFPGRQVKAQQQPAAYLAADRMVTVAASRSHHMLEGSLDCAQRTI